MWSLVPSYLPPSPPDSPQPPRSLMNHLPCMLPCTLRAYRCLQCSPPLSCCSNHHPLYHLPGLPHPHRCYLPRLSLLLHQLAQSPGVSYLQQSPSWSPGQRHYRPHHSHCSSPCNCPPSKCPPRLSPPSTPSNLHRNRPAHPLQHHCSLFPLQPSQPHPHSMWSLVPSYLPHRSLGEPLLTSGYRWILRKGLLPA